jgi:hydroxyacylglutathione hydrolase
LWCDETKQAAVVDPGGTKALSERFSVPIEGPHKDDKVTFGNIELEVYFCSGDVIFSGAIGRTDFPRGDQPTLIKSIRENLFPLGDDVRFIPGHGPMSTFGQEHRSNPYVSDNAVKN